MQGSKVALKWLQFAIMILLVIGVMFRFLNIDHKVYWLDETYSALRISGFTRAELLEQVFDGQVTGINEIKKYQYPNAEKGVTDTLRSLAVEDPKHPPLPYVAARFWMQSLGNTVATRRTLMALYSALSLPCMFWLCWELFKLPLVSWVATGLLAISPLQVLYAQDAKQYSLLILVTLLSSASLLRALRLNTRSSWAVYSLTLTMGLYTHSFYTMVAIAHGSYVLASEKFRLSKLIRNYIISGVAALVMFLPWLCVIAINYSNSQLAGHLSKRLPIWSLINVWVTNLGRNFFDIDLVYYKSLKYLNTPTILINWLIVGLVGYSIYFISRKAPRNAWLFVLLLMGITGIVLGLPDVILGGQRSTEARYLFPCYLGFIISIAYLLATQLSINTVQLKRTLWSGVFVLLISSGVLSCWMASQADVWWHQFSSYSTPPAARAINKSEQPLVVSDTLWGHVLSLSHLLKPTAQLQVVVAPNIPEIPANATDVYLFRPSGRLLEALSKNYQIEAVPETNKVLRLRERTAQGA